MSFHSREIEFFCRYSMINNPNPNSLNWFSHINRNYDMGKRPSVFSFYITRCRMYYRKNVESRSFTRKLAAAILRHRIEMPSRKAGHISSRKPNSHHPFRVLSSSHRSLTRPKRRVVGTRSTREKMCKYFKSDRCLK